MSDRTSARQPTPREDDWDEDESEPPHPTTSVVNAHALFRLLLILLAAWSIFEGVALATGAFSAVDAGTDRTAERMLGGMMIVLGGVYGMLAWRRGQYRLLLWVPFAAQIAIVVPLLFSFDRDRILLLVISSAFLVMMLYVWWQSRDIDDPYGTYDDDEYAEGDDEEGEDEDLADYADSDDEDDPPAKRASTQSRTARFRRREG